MVRNLLIAALVFGMSVLQVKAQEMSLISLTDHKSVLLSETTKSKAVEIKLGSPVAADQLIGLAVGDVLPEHEGKELIVLRSDRHLEFYPLPDHKMSVLKRYGYCPIANPAKRDAVAIAVAQDQLFLLAKVDDTGWQYAETFAMDAVTLTQAIKRSSFISLKSADSPHQPVQRIDAAGKVAWTGADSMVLLTTAADRFFELYKVHKTSGQRMGQGFKQVGQVQPVAARWCQQRIVALYEDGSLAEFDQTLPEPRIVKASPTQHVGVVDFVVIDK